MPARLLMLGALLSLVAGILSGLARIGGPLPEHVYTHILAHGPVMVCGVLGLLISLERAVALEEKWAFGAPAFALAGTGAALTPGGLPSAAWIYSASAAWLFLVTLRLSRRAPGLAVNLMLAGVLAWLAGNLLWAQGGWLGRSAIIWICFPVLLIVGERVELSARFRMNAIVAGLLFVPTLSLVLGAFWRVYPLFGLGLLGLAYWLFRYDILFGQIKNAGQPRFMSLALLGGYAWLFAAGLLALLFNGLNQGGLLVGDALLHSVFLGFVFSMIFAHAPIIFPAVSGLKMRFSRLFYVHLALLHVSLLVRFAGDLWFGQEIRRLGGWLGAAALVIFLINNAQGMLRGRALKI